MGNLTRWKVIEKPVERRAAKSDAEAALALGACGAVTSWGSGISHRETLRVFWDAATPGLPEKLGKDFASAEDMIEEDWRPHWKASLAPFRVGSRFALVPAWEEAAGDAEFPIRIDPGMAFGAGDHPTTRLCVAALEGLAEKGEARGPALDVGAGTGVLALAAAKLGFSPVVALDIDPFCYASCKRNAKRNNLAGMVKPLLSSLDLVEESYPLVLANVASRQLEAMALLLSARVATGGLLLLSGFERDAGERIERCFSPLFKLEKKTIEEGWLALLMRKWA